MGDGALAVRALGDGLVVGRDGLQEGVEGSLGYPQCNCMD